MRRILTHRDHIDLASYWHPGLRLAASGPGPLTPTGRYLGTHDAQVYTDDSGARWLVKPGTFSPHLDYGTAQLQAAAGLPTPEMHIVDVDGETASAQRMYDATDAFGWDFDPTRLSDADRAVLQRHHVLDWLMSNHDSHPGQYIRDNNTGELIGIDKGQAYRYFGRDFLDWDFHPNDYYGEREPVHNTMWKAFANGDIELEDPRSGDFGEFIQRVQGLPDDQVREWLRPYAEAAAAEGKLMATGGPQPGLAPQNRHPANDPEAFLDAVIERKNRLAEDFGALYDRALAQRSQRVAHTIRTAQWLLGEVHSLGLIGGGRR